jgi:uncharacterized protein (DUF427 family)
MKATWNGQILAESDSTIVIEGNHYFPPDSVRWELLTESPTTTVCGWKGTASYYSVNVESGELSDAAWTYRTPLPAAEEITGYVAFWKGVEVHN